MDAGGVERPARDAAGLILVSTCPKTSTSSFRRRGVGGAFLCDPESDQPPVVPSQPKLVEDRLVLLVAARLPVRRELIAQPGMRQLAELGHRDDCSGITCPEPSLDVLFRPEEIHRVSGEDDVVPPARSGNQRMKEKTLVIDPLFVHFDRD